MDNQTPEPQARDATAAAPRPCSTPHSAPVAWLKSEPSAVAPALSEVEGSAAEGPPPAPADPQQLEDVIALLRSDPDALAQVVSQLSADDDVRRDGWTPFSRRLFLSVLAETGRVTTACDYAQLTKQSAYALRARDPVFAAGWDAACEIARAPLADALYERALDGVTETITRGGEVVAERHRHDSRLSIAVLHRLDKRCDRAAEMGSRHLALVAHWEDWLRLVGKGEDQAAGALLETAPHGQFGQLPLVGNPTAAAESEAGEPVEIDLSDRFWDRLEQGEKVWMTDLPPPPGFTGYENRPFDEDRDVETYQRECTDEEAALLEADAAAAVAAERAEEEALRDTWFDLLRAGLDPAPSRHPGLNPGPAVTSTVAGEIPDPPQGRATSDSPRE